jgi:hypothetical protein
LGNRGGYLRREQLQRCGYAVVNQHRERNHRRQKEKRERHRPESRATPKTPRDAGQQDDERNPHQEEFGARFPQQVKETSGRDEPTAPTVGRNGMPKRDASLKPGYPDRERGDEQPLGEVRVIPPVGGQIDQRPSVKESDDARH